MAPSFHRAGWAVALLLLAGCHHSPRDNPFDPALTPAVVLQVALDDTAGTAALQWTRYEGPQSFKEYRVLRRIADRIQEDTLRHIAAVDSTAFQDTTIAPDLDYLYWVEVVNQAGFAASTPEVRVSSFTVRGVELLEARGNDSQGVISLRWQRYRGPDFVRYEVRRRSFGEDEQRLESLTATADTTWIDASPFPEREYSYWIKTFAAGKELVSQRREASYQLPPIELQPVAFSSETATATLVWTQYQGPRFAGYEVRRQVEGATEVVADTLADISRTRYTDPLLDGNTEYVYRIFTRTSWGEAVGRFSNAQSGRFYGLEQVVALPGLGNAEVQAVGLALDEQDQLYVAATAISTTTARVMSPGISIKFPGQSAYRSFFAQVTPEWLSPVHVTAGQGRVYVAVRTQEDSIVVGAVEAETLRAAWSVQVGAGSAFPAGFHREADGALLLVDTEGMVYRLSAEGVPEAPSDKLKVSLENDQALPLRHLVVGRGAGPGGNDQFFLLVPERDNNHIVGRTRPTPLLFGGKGRFDDGVGPGNGQTLNPRVLAFDPSRTRLMVLEDQGRLQVLNAAPEDVPRRYITKWGRFGTGPGEFLVSPPTAVAMAVDSQGRVYVADGGERIQVFAP